MRGEMAGGSERYTNFEEWERKLRLYWGLVDEYEALDNPPADTLLDLYAKIGELYYAVSQYRQALDWSEKLLELAKRSGERRFQGVALDNLGGVYAALGEKRRTLEFYEAALAIRREVGDRAGEGTTLNNIGWLYLNEGDKAQARVYLEQALAIAEAVEYSELAAAARNGLAR